MHDVGAKRSDRSPEAVHVPREELLRRRADDVQGLLEKRARVVLIVSLKT